MSTPVQWPGGGEPQGAAEARAARLLRKVGDPPPFDRAQKARVLARIRSVLAERRSPPRWTFLAVGGLTAGVAAALLALVIIRWRAPSPAPGSAADEVVASAGADYDLASEPEADGALRLVIRVGSVEVHPRNPHRPVAVHAPHLEARVVATTFWVQAAAEVTTLTVGEGEAWIGEVVHLHRGESIRSDDARLRPPAPRPAPTPAPAVPAETVASCDGLISLNARRDCYVRLSQGTDLAAQNALFELGMLQVEELEQGAAGIETFRLYQGRFPAGPLAPEAAYAELAELLAEHRSEEAHAAGERFVARFPKDGRVPEIKAQLQRLANGSAR